MGMEIFTGLTFHMKNSAVSLGKFDGIHKGHRLLLQTVLEQNTYIPTVFTFEIPPDSGTVRGVENPASSKKLIYTQQEKDQILRKMGMQGEVIFPLREETRCMSPTEFIQQILYGRMDAKFICVGEDFRFGKDRSGDVELLQREAEPLGMTVKVLPKLKVDGDVVSSTRIREQLSIGNIKQVNNLLGEPYFICGKVVHGNALGRTMQMPTANLLPVQEKALPPFGVYATKVILNGKNYPAVTNVGKKPTVGGQEIGVESCLLDFDENIYGSEISVEFHQFLRPEQKFSSLDTLQEQMKRDKEEAGNYFHC